MTDYKKRIESLLLSVRSDEYGDSGNYNDSKLEKTIEALLHRVEAETVERILSVKTEGLFDGPDLFIKRAPIEQECINIIGYEAFKAIQESLPAPVAHREES